MLYLSVGLPVQGQAVLMTSLSRIARLETAVELSVQLISGLESYKESLTWSLSELQSPARRPNSRMRGNAPHCMTSLDFACVCVCVCGTATTAGETVCVCRFLFTVNRSFQFWLFRVLLSRFSEVEGKRTAS